MTKKYQRHTTLKLTGKSMWPAFFVIGFILSSHVACDTTEFVALINGTVSLNCNGRSSSNFRWRRGDGLKVYIAGEGFGRQYENRSHIENDKLTGAKILKISSLKSEDAESYKCFATDEITLLHTTQLTVLYSDPTCDSNIRDNGFYGSKTCGNTYQDDMRLSCAVNYNGTAPRLQWEIANTSQIFKDSECDKNETTKWINCTLTLKAEPQYDGSVFRCKVKTSHGEQYSCITKAIKVLYFTPDERALNPTHKAIGDKVSCSVKSNLKLNFNWMREENNMENVVSTNPSYVIHEDGLYYCNVSYNIKDVSCWAVVSVVHTHHTEGCSVIYTTLAIAFIVLACFIGIIFVISIVVACVKTENTQAKGWLICAAFTALIRAFISLLAACILGRKATAPEPSRPKSQEQELQGLNKERDDLPKAEKV